MSEYISLIKIIKKGKKIQEPKDVYSLLIKHLSNIYSEKIDRELNFVALYYGLNESALTLEAIGQKQENQLTRERVRQIIDSIVDNQLKKDSVNDLNAYQIAQQHFFKILENKPNFLRVEDLLEHEVFIGFKNNIKGLISFLNDCGIKQIAYRKKYYFYNTNLERRQVISLIQKQNKALRREKTVKKMSLKAKTVTYVPNEVREHLLSYAEKNDQNLNPLYEKILLEFIKEKPYLDISYFFSKTKSWKARKGKAEWKQIGIYIEKNIFNQIKEDVEKIKIDLHKNVSLMSFICQAFIWHYEKTHK